MRIVFMGSPDFALPSLEKLHQSPHEIVAVVSNVDKRRGRGSGASATPVKAKALELDLPVIEADDLHNLEFHAELQSLQPDLFVVVAFRILPPDVLEIPSRGSINLHASLLPKFRGAAPIHWAVINGEEETGVTIFFLDQQVDTGNILTRQKTAIGPNETTGDVYERLKKIGGNAILDAVEDIASGDVKTTSQDDSQATEAPKLFTEDCRIDFKRPAAVVHNKIRGLSPFPTAWAMLGDEKFNIYRSELADGNFGSTLSAGELRVHDGRVLAGCKDAAVALIEVQREGKRRMSGRDFMHGFNGDPKLS